MKQVKILHNYLIKNNLTLSLAESCTGGNLTFTFVKNSGSSKYLLGSVIAYSNYIKIKTLGVFEESLIKYGAVSREVVTEMVEGMQILTQSDLSIAVTGIAGPGGGTNEKPIGTVWAACVLKNHKPLIWKMELTGSRLNIIRQISDQIIKETIQYLSI